MRKTDPLAKYDRHLNHWVKKSGIQYTIGLSDWAISYMGAIKSIDIVIHAGQYVEVDSIYAIIECDKSSLELQLPMGGIVTTYNENLGSEPQLINEDNYNSGWMLQLKASQEIEYQELFSADKYLEAIDSFFKKG